MTVLEASSNFADALYLKYVGRELLLKKMLAEGGVTVITNAKVQSIGKDGVAATVQGEKKVFPADTVLVALGREADGSAVATWQDAAPKVIAVGDCAEPRTIRNAIHSAARAVLSL